ncbi:MAG: DUF3332 family protein [Nitrospiraceae bacterium]
MMRWSHFRKGLVCMVLASIMGISTACYGPFNLTKNVYHWNSGIKGSGEVSEKWMKEFVFFGMIVVPVYMFSVLLDAFIFNSIQFWSGDNPVKASELGDDGQTKVAQVGDLTMRWTPTSEGATVTYDRHGIIERRATIVSNATGYRLLDERGMTLAEAEFAFDGTLAVLDHDCQVVQRWTGDQLRSIVQSNGISPGESVALMPAK